MAGELVTLDEMRQKILNDKTHPLHDQLKKAIVHVEKRNAEICDLCGKRYDEHDNRGFIYFTGEDGLKAGWECVEKLVRKNKLKGQ